MANGIELRRYKTGTPARIDGNTIERAKVLWPSDKTPIAFIKYAWNSIFVDYYATTVNMVEQYKNKCKAELDAWEAFESEYPQRVAKQQKYLREYLPQLVEWSDKIILDTGYCRKIVTKDNIEEILAAKDISAVETEKVPDPKPVHIGG